VIAPESARLARCAGAWLTLRRRRTAIALYERGMELMIRLRGVSCQHWAGGAFPRIVARTLLSPVPRLRTPEVVEFDRTLNWLKSISRPAPEFPGDFRSSETHLGATGRDEQGTVPAGSVPGGFPSRAQEKRKRIRFQRKTAGFLESPDPAGTSPCVTSIVPTTLPLRVLCHLGALRF
jgi:hypothetical protein